MTASQANPVSADALPPAVQRLSESLTRMGPMGSGTIATEIGFWRARTQIEELNQCAEELRKLLHDGQFLEEARRQGDTVRQAFEAVHKQTQAMVQEVPFEKRVNLLHRSLVPCYQQIYILENLLRSVIVRLRRQPRSKDNVQAGSMLQVDSRRQMRKSFRKIVPCWDKETWDLYDTV
jgi:hypothetical protein